jgi:hypothetical protein
MAEDDEAEVYLPLHTEEDVAQRLSTFLERHPYSKIVTHKTGGTELRAVDSPWGDQTLIMLIDDDLDPLAEVLNNVILPERLSAVWHQDTKDLEVIWTAHNLVQDQMEIAKREFTFLYGKTSYRCEFGEASERLLILAANIMPISNPSGTNFRNLQSFNAFVHLKTEEERKDEFLGEARSFWVRGAKLSEKLLLDLISRLNFYMTYFDSRSPTILIHNVEPSGTQSKIRYVRGDFPKSIKSKPLDQNLTSFWAAANIDNEMLRFILYYRVIEYAAHHYVDATIRHKLKMIFADPMCGSDADKAIEMILDALDPGRADEVPRFNALLESAVDPSLVWREIDQNKASFTGQTKFDGDFILEPIISKSETEDTFRSGGLVKFGDSIRKIRNVLAHGRDQRTAKVITPSLRNLKLLRPWVNAVAVAAGEVVLYESVS